MKRSILCLLLVWGACGGGTQELPGPRVNETPGGYVRRRISLPTITVPLIEVDDPSMAGGVNYVAPDTDNHVVIDVDLTNKPGASK